MKTATILLLCLATVLGTACVPITAAPRAKKPFPTEPSEQMYALYYDGSRYEAPPMGWAKARELFMQGKL